VVVLYSRHDRGKDHDLVIRLTEEFSRLLPSPKWKLVVDVGSQVAREAPQPTQTATSAGQREQVQQQEPPTPPQPQQQGQHYPQQNPMTEAQQPQGSNASLADPASLTTEVISIFGEHMPSDPTSPAFAYLQGFMSLRLLLLRTTRTEQEQDIVNTILSSYSSYKAGGRSRPDIALMLARDFMFLNQQHQPQAQTMQPVHQQQQQHLQSQMQTMQQQQHQQMIGTQQQYGQQAYAPAPSQMPHMQTQQQSQNAMFTTGMAGGNPNLSSMPPPSPHASSSGGAKLDGTGGFHPNGTLMQNQQDQMVQQQQALGQHQAQLSQHHQQQTQYHHQQSQSQQYQQVDAGMPSNGNASGDGGENPAAVSTES
jgi:hypothetical protein